MILRRVGFAFALMVGSLGVCKAETIGPLTFGSGFPFGEGSLISTPGGGYIVPFEGPGLHVDSLDGEIQYDHTYTFSFDLAPGFQIDRVLLRDNVDFGGPEVRDPDFMDWGFAFGEKVVLCPSAGPCADGSTGDRVHASALPPLSLGSVAGPGTGIFEVAVDVRNQQITTDGGTSGLTIFLSPSPTPIPEPSPVWLLVLGIAGLPVVKLLRERNQQRHASAPNIG